MAFIQKRGPKRWTARYIDPEGRERAKSFQRKSDAEKFIASVAHSIQTGAFIDPSLGRLTVEEWSRVWAKTLGHLKVSTRERYLSILRTHVLPRWGTVRLQGVSHAAIQSWCSDLAERSPSAAHKAHRVLSLLLALAIKDGRLARNPADGISLPREAPKERLFLTHDEVRVLADAAGVYRALILFLAYTGARFGEAAALRVSRLDLTGRRVAIRESVTSVNGNLVWGTPKNHESRMVALPPFLVAELQAHVSGKGRVPPSGVSRVRRQRDRSVGPGR